MPYDIRKLKINSRNKWNCRKLGVQVDQSPDVFWRKCSSCKKPIALNAKYYECSVSTCNRIRTGYVFCSVDCFERHLPGARHKQAGAIEKTAPSKVEVK
jgi:hypothetical protein